MKAGIFDARRVGSIDLIEYDEKGRAKLYTLKQVAERVGWSEAKVREWRVTVQGARPSRTGRYPCYTDALIKRILAYKADEMPGSVRDMRGLTNPVYSVTRLRELFGVTDLTMRAWLAKAGRDPSCKGRAGWRTAANGYVVLNGPQRRTTLLYQPEVFAALWPVVKPEHRHTIIREAERILGKDGS